ncbi:hypothetical protein SPSIL_010560 [Sporomusa silvacetica DSM 10669]|uniref:Microcin J25-processing protein McjB C-terminal domain-containing protein n=1 Tax=Sporomusa silvacetica DSM 10669 TaxID=1123289 RepID=A0ABZ3IHH1_9FIRM|nr:lasso peptide biosynthesis B2 protein [Sporomusa silvacetica]OZC21430.1 hypothetical protein SPSIL_10350 [Sporomusa silvacetica DSM 10669]
MLKVLEKIYALSWQEKRIYIEFFLLAGVVRLAILLLPFSWQAMFLGKHMRESSIDECTEKMAFAKQVGRIIETASRYTPWESKCLVQAVVGKMMLRQQGIANTLYLGVARNEGDNLIAHAWLRCGNTIITGRQGKDKFTVVGKFADYSCSNRIIKGGDTI